MKKNLVFLCVFLLLLSFVSANPYEEGEVFSLSDGLCKVDVKFQKSGLYIEIMDSETLDNYGIGIMGVVTPETKNFSGGMTFPGSKAEFIYFVEENELLITDVEDCDYTICSETDDGKDYFTRSFFEVGNSGGSEYCVDEDTLFERYCVSAKEITFEIYECPNGCYDGACIKEETPQEEGTCRDTDGGKDYFTKGTVYYIELGIQGDTEDRCEGAKLIEAYCQGVKTKTIEFICPERCDEGECKEVLDECSFDSQCDDKDNSTKDFCEGNPKKCKNTEITECISGDKYCPEPCCYAEDQDCKVPDECTNNTNCDDKDPCTKDFCEGIPKKCINKIEKKGCNHENKCISTGERIEDKYCNKEGEITEQKNNKEQCTEAYECNSNSCISNVCINQNIILRVFEWIRRIFN